MDLYDDDDDNNDDNCFLSRCVYCLKVCNLPSESPATRLEQVRYRYIYIESLMSCHLLLHLLHELANMILCEALPSII